jgi:hypothetical protein
MTNPNFEIGPVPLNARNRFFTYRQVIDELAAELV